MEASEIEKNRFANVGTDYRQTQQTDTQVAQTTTTQTTDAPTAETAQTEGGNQAPTTETTYTKDWFKENLGIENPDELKTVYTGLKEKASKYDTIEPEYNTLKNTPELTPFAKIANELERKGVDPKTIARFHGLEPSKLSDDEALQLAEKLKTPTLTEQQVGSLLTAKYHTDEDTPEWKKLATEAQKAQDAAIARGEISKHVAEVFNPESKPVNQELVKQEQNRVSYFQQNASKLDANVLKYEVNTQMKFQGRGGEETLSVPFKYELPQDKAQQLMNTVGQIVTNPVNASMFTPNENGLSQANAQLEALFWAQEGKNIVAKMNQHIKDVESKIHEHYATILHNPHRQQTVQNQPLNTGSAEDRFNRGMAGAIGKLKE